MEWVGLLRDGDFDAAAARVDTAVPEGAMSADRLGQIWQQVSMQLGALESLAPGPVTESDPYHVVDLAASFENQSLTIRVTLTDSLRVSGFFFRPAEPPPYEAPAYVDTTAFREVEVTVGEAPWELPGVLTVPVGDGSGGDGSGGEVRGADAADEAGGERRRESGDASGDEPGDAPGAGSLPVVVLVHGSGPNDMDETIGSNRPFRDLAWGLASAGVAVLRYDKRTRAHGASLPPGLGLEEEVIDDALSALALVADRPEIDGDRVFLLGHSLGGMLAPEIARRAAEDGGAPEPAGVVVLAGPARPFLDVIREQLAYIASLEADPDAPNRVAIDSILAELDAHETAAASDAPGPAAAPDSLLGVPMTYWRELQAVDPVATARALDAPMLILQGGRDYQVTGADLALWREGLGDRDDVTTRLYPDLNHLFMPGEGMATPAEYMGETKHVAGAVIEDIAAWIRGRR
jgi:hypothetical protein